MNWPETVCPATGQIVIRRIASPASPQSIGISCSSVHQASHFRAKRRAAFYTVLLAPKSRPAWATGSVWKSDRATISRHPPPDRAQDIIAQKVAWKRRQFQMIGANLDYVIIVQSCHFDFNLKRLERYLVMVTEGGAEPYILLTKTDLLAPAALAAQMAEIHAGGNIRTACR